MVAVPAVYEQEQDYRCDEQYSHCLDDPEPALPYSHELRIEQDVDYAIAANRREAARRQPKLRR
jgi:hypothetical protein